MFLALLLPWPSASADLTVTTSDGQQFTIDTGGATSLDAPQNLSLALHNIAVRLLWDAPVSASPDGYRVYRVPGPGTNGSTTVFDLDGDRTSFVDRAAAAGSTYVYFVTALFGSDDSQSESVPSPPAATADQAYPHCGVVGIYFTPPYYSTQISCLFPVP
jgi:hypothetical protein